MGHEPSQPNKSSSTRSSNRAFVGILVVLFISAIGATLPTPLYVLYQRRFYLSEITLTLIYGVYILGSITALLFFGRLSDQIGRRVVILSGLGVGIVSTVVYIFAHFKSLLFVGRVLSGFSTAIVLGAATAYLVELQPQQDKRRAAVLTALTLTAGLGTGPLLSGLLAQFGPLPTILAFCIFIPLLAAPIVISWRTRETVTDLCDHVSLRPRIGVPEGKRLPFVSPVSTGFCVFALQGFFGVIIPSMLVKNLDRPNHLLAGVMVFELYIAAALTIWLSRNTRSQKAMLSGIALLIPALALILVAFELHSLSILIAATACGGVSVGFGFKGSLEVVNQLAPGDQRNEIMADYYLFTYLGLALPAIGVGVLTQLVNALTANLTFAALITVLAAAALFMGLRYRQHRQRT